MYGQCVVADYNSVHKDKCAAEFARLKDCYLVGFFWFFFFAIYQLFAIPSSTSQARVCSLAYLLTHLTLRKKTESLEEDPVMA